MRLSRRPWPLALAVCATSGLLLAACRVEAPALECVRDSQCRFGQHCENNRCVAGAALDGGGDVPADVAGDPVDDGTVDLPADTPADGTGSADADPDTAVDLADADAPEAPDEPAEDGADARDVRPDLPSFDPAPEITEPGEHRCAEAPDAELAETATFEVINALPNNVFIVSGNVTGSGGSGTWWVGQAAGGQAIGTLPVNADGSFRAVVPIECDAVQSNVVKLVWRGTPCDLVLVFDVLQTLCWREEVHVGLWWNTAGDDLDLHLIREGGQLNRGADDCNSHNCIPLGPDWGELGLPGNPRKNFDSASDGGPEEIVIENGASGTYIIAVERWGTDDVPSDAIIVTTLEGDPFVTMKSELPPLHVWLAAEVDFEQGLLLPINQVEDCTEDWDFESGCMLELP